MLLLRKVDLASGIRDFLMNFSEREESYQKKRELRNSEMTLLMKLIPQTWSHSCVKCPKRDIL
jgi:hypothetical protein